MTEQDKMREAFENVMRGSGLPLDRAGDGYYGVTDAAWIGYQAALLSERARLLPVLKMAREALRPLIDYTYLVVDDRYNAEEIDRDEAVKNGSAALAAINEVLGKE
jgi:hypothetical protein